MQGSETERGVFGTLCGKERINTQQQTSKRFSVVLERDSACSRSSSDSSRGNFTSFQELQNNFNRRTLPLSRILSLGSVLLGCAGPAEGQELKFPFLLLYYAKIKYLILFDSRLACLSHLTFGFA